MGELRTPKKTAEYRAFIAKGFLADGCNLCKEKGEKEFKYWKILKPKFPWDRIAKEHNMILPKRHVMEKGLTNAEKKEFEKIKKDFIEKEYEYIIETTHHKKSIPTHLHLHLIIAKD